MSQTDTGRNFVEDDILEHHGVKGQKWGVRRKRGSGSSGPPKRSVKDMSDAELREAVNRMNMEQQFLRLSSGRSASASRGRRAIAAGAAFAGGLALNVARSQLQNQANARVGAALARRGK